MEYKKEILVLRESCFRGIENAVVSEIKKTPEHDAIVKLANEQIQKHNLKYAKAYCDAKQYY